MSHESRELELHIDNTRRLYEQKIAIFKNLAKKKAKGEYRADLGVKGLVHLTTSGAKDYGREYGTGDGLRIFSTAARREAAGEFEKEFQDWYATDWKHSEEGRKYGIAAIQKQRKANTKRSEAANAGRRPLSARVGAANRAAYCSICRGPHVKGHRK